MPFRRVMRLERGYLYVPEGVPTCSATEIPLCGCRSFNAEASKGL
jgi:hypothetical protein